MFYEPQVQQAVEDAIVALENTSALPLQEAIDANKALIVLEKDDNKMELKK